MQNDVLFAILINLMARPRTAQELAEKHEMSLRSIYRYIDTLEASGIPVMRKAGRNGGFYLDSAHFIDKAFFTDEEYRYLKSLTDGVKVGGKIADAVADKIAALAKMKGCDGYRISPDTLVIDTDNWQGSSNRTVAALQDAIDHCISLDICYRDADGKLSQRLIYPHTLVLKNGIWYTYAYCTLRADWRLFSIGRIVNYTNRQPFERMSYDLDRVPWKTLPCDKGEKIVLRVSGDAARRIADEYPDVEFNGDQAVFTAHVNRTLTENLLRYGEEITVLQPLELRHDLKDKLSQALCRYQDTPSNETA